MKRKVTLEISADESDFILWRLLDHTRFMISRLRERELDQFGITPETAYILDILAQNEGMVTMNELVAITARRHHSISTQIARMVRQGLVDKHKNPADNRGYNLVITAKGQDLFKRITRDSIKQAFACLSEEDKKTLGTRLSSLMFNAYQLNGKDYPQTFPH